MLKVISNDQKMVDIAATIAANNIELPTLEWAIQQWDDGLNNLDQHPWLDSEENEFPHMHTSEGKLCKDGDVFIFIPYYSYEWSHGSQFHGACNAPVIW